MKNKFSTIALIAVFSIVLWGSVTLSTDYFATLNIPVKFIGIPDNTAISKVSNKELIVKLKGQGWQLAKVTFGRDLEYHLAVKQDVGQQTVLFRNSVELNSWVSSNVAIEEFIPESIELTLEEITAKKVPIVPDVSLNFMPGYGLVSKIKIDPDSVFISGPNSIVKKTNNIKTVLLEADDIERNFNETVNLLPVEGLIYDEDKTSILLDIQKIVDKTFDDINVIAKNVPRDEELILYPSTIKVILRGGILYLGRLSESDVTATIDYKDALTDTTGSLIPNIEIPSNSVLIDYYPDKLEYIIKKF